MARALTQEDTVPLLIPTQATPGSQHCPSRNSSHLKPGPFLPLIIKPVKPLPPSHLCVQASLRRCLLIKVDLSDFVESKYFVMTNRI
jgi:hypothetical protein